METHTVTGQNKDTIQFKKMTWKDLNGLGFAFNSPFCLDLIDNNVLLVTEVIRIIPKKRMVLFAEWQGKAVVAKLFFASSQAKYHMEKDAAGIKKLQDYKIPAPKLYYQGKTQDKRIYLLIFERILAAQNLEDIFQAGAQELFPIMQSVVKELATQHVFGVFQNDLHFKNFLVTEKIIYSLDGGEIEIFPGLLPKKQSMNNIALFLSQLGMGCEISQEKLFRYYAKLRGWSLKKDDLKELFFFIKKWTEQRWKRFEKKIFRECTPFSPIRCLKTTGVVARPEMRTEFLAFVEDPDSVFTHPTAKILKAGRSATVVHVILDQRPMVIKRYNIKNIWHRLRRCLRPTRAKSSWRLAQKLNLFHIPTAKPIAFIENKFLCFVGRSYFVTDYIAGNHIGDFFLKNAEQEDIIHRIIIRITALLKNLAKLEITHGDLKKSNIIIDQQEQPMLIDLDGAAEHLSISSLHKAWHKEILRFLDNFNDNPILQERFRQELYTHDIGV